MACTVTENNIRSLLENKVQILFTVKPFIFADRKNRVKLSREKISYSLIEKRDLRRIFLQILSIKSH